MAQNPLDISNPSVDNSNPNVTRVNGVTSTGAPATGANADQSQGNTAAGATAVGNPIRTGAVVRPNADKLTRTNGQTADIITDENENQHVREAYAPGYEDNVANVAKAEQRFSNTYISTATTTTVKTGSGLLHTLVVNGGTAGTITGYDNTAASGTILFAFDTTNAIMAYAFDCTFSTGLTIVTSAATKVSVNWR